MHSGPSTEPCFQATSNLTPLFSGMRGLNETQLSILNDYFEDYLGPNLQAFIDTAPAEPDLRPVRKFLIIKATSLSCDRFSAFLSHFYPKVPDNADADYKLQNEFFGELLTKFNELCSGTLDINHTLYAAVFDAKLSPTKHNSPTKRNLFSAFFKKKIADLITDNDLENNIFVRSMIDWLHHYEHGGNPTVLHNTSAKKRLLFEF